MPYQLRATSQFALGELFRERVQALIERQPPSIQMDEADFIMLDTSAFSDLHQCVKCVTKTKNHPLILSHLKPDESLEDWVQLHRRLLQEHSQNMVKWLHDTINNLRGRRKYRSIFFVLSRIGAAYPTDLMAKGTMKLFGQDVVPVGIEPRYSGKRREEPFIQVPYPTHFHRKC